jgi:hypothetical protein
MAFKIKDGVRIGTVDVFNNSGVLQVPATNLIGGNGTTLLGSIPYQSGTDTTTQLAPNTTSTKKFLRMTGTGTNGAAPAWDTVTAADVGLTIGTNVQAWDADLDAFAALAATTGFIRKTGAATYTIDTTTYLSTNPNLQTVTGVGATTSNAVSITNATASTTTATGCLILSGGLGVAGAVYAGSLQGTPVGSTAASTGAFTTLGATGAVTLSPASANVIISPTGTGLVTINPATAGSIDRMSIGATTRSSGAFTTLDANSTVGLSPASANVTISPTGTGTVTISPVGALTINPTAASTINNCSIGATTRGSGSFTTLDANNAVGLSPNNQNVTISPTGTGTVTINPTGASTINNCSIGGSTRGSGAFTTLASNGATTMTAGTSSTTTGTGTLVVTGGVGISENLNVGGSAVITGNLTVNGTTTTINSTAVTVDDIIMVLGGDTAPGSDDALDKGIEFRWYSGAAKLGFFGFDRSTGNFTFIPDATDTGGVLSGTKGTLDAYLDWSNVSNKPALGTGSVTNVNVGNGMNFTSFTDIGTITLGTPSALTATTTDALTSNSHTHSISTGTPSSLSNVTTNQTGTGTALARADHTHAITGFLTTASTLQAVTTAGASSSNAITISNATDATTNATGALILSAGGLAVKSGIFHSGDYSQALTAGTRIATENVTQTSLSTVTTTAISSVAIATFRSGKYTVQITQGTNYQVSNVMVIHNGTTTIMTEYAVLETNGVLGTLTSDVSGGNMRLLVTMGSAAAATINVKGSFIVV